ncbi:polysaccharide deacetylase family protein [Actinoplanes sp. NPDC049118]|uniref:polysaccharide deacetylase family protein n=1 Tax=Actinoplanes sp. NPDC049118 TaxID=3155769 RepID=UPI0033E99C44
MSNLVPRVAPLGPNLVIPEVNISTGHAPFLYRGDAPVHAACTASRSTAVEVAVTLRPRSHGGGAQSLPIRAFDAGFDPTRFQTRPPACYRASWQLPGPDSHRQATTSLQPKIDYISPPPGLLDARKREANVAAMSDPLRPKSHRPPRRSLLKASAVGAGVVAAGTGATMLAAGTRIFNSGSARPMLLGAPSAVAALTPASWSQNFQKGHDWTATGGNVGKVILDDTTGFVRGKQSVSLTTAGRAGDDGTDADQASVERLGGPAVNLKGKAIRLIFKVSDVNKLRWINFYVGTSGLANAFRWRVHTHSNKQNWVQSGEWVAVTLQWGDLNGSSGAYKINAARVPSVRAGFTDMRFSVIDAGAGPCTVWLQAVEIVPDVNSTYSNGLVSITFDDSWQDVFTNGRPLMDKYDFRGTTYTIADQINTGGKFTTDQLRAAQNLSGWEVAGHSYQGAVHAARYSGVRAEVVDKDAGALRGWMRENNFHSDSFAYPGGQFGQTTDGHSIEAIVQRYFSTGRSILAEDNRECTPPPMPMRLRSLTGISSTQKGMSNPDTLIGRGGLLDRAQYAGGWLILCFHRVVTTTPADSSECHRDDFKKIMRAIKARGMEVRTVGEVMS